MLRHDEACGHRCLILKFTSVWINSGRWESRNSLVAQIGITYVIGPLVRLWISWGHHVTLIPWLVMGRAHLFVGERWHFLEVRKLRVVMSQHFWCRLLRLESWQHLWEPLSIPRYSIVVVIPKWQFLPPTMISRHALNIREVLLTWHTINWPKVFLGQHSIFFTLLLLIQDFCYLSQLFRVEWESFGCILLGGQWG